MSKFTSLWIKAAFATLFVFAVGCQPPAGETDTAVSTDTSVPAASSNMTESVETPAGSGSSNMTTGTETP